MVPFMGQITIRGTRADLPCFEEDITLNPVSSFGPAGGSLADFRFGAASVRALDVKDVRLTHGKVHSVRAEAATITGAHIRSVEFARCELGSLRWTGGKISRTRFDACKLLGARFESVTLEHVVFTDCKMDYAMLSQIQTTGPVLFVRCSLREAEFAGCNLTGSLFDESDLFRASFGPGRYVGCDLRGNDLSTVNSVHHLKRAVIDRSQLLQLATALAINLDVTFGDELDGPVATA